MVRLADESADRGAARAVVRCPGSGDAAGAVRGDPDAGLRGRALLSAWSLLQSDSLQVRPDGHRSRWPVLLERAPGITVRLFIPRRRAISRIEFSTSRRALLA